MSAIVRVTVGWIAGVVVLAKSDVPPQYPRVDLVAGLVTCIVPVDRNLIRVGPVKTQPDSMASSFIREFDAGMSRTVS
jgi:hypothetical protein